MIFPNPLTSRNISSFSKRLSNTSGEGVSAILINGRGQVLLQQRDDNPAIRYPGHWSLFGGTIEEGESAATAVAREVKEEIDFDDEKLRSLSRVCAKQQKRVRVCW